MAAVRIVWRQALSILKEESVVVRYPTIKQLPKLPTHVVASDYTEDLQILFVEYCTRNAFS